MWQERRFSENPANLSSSHGEAAIIELLAAGPVHSSPPFEIQVESVYAAVGPWPEYFRSQSDLLLLLPFLALAADGRSGYNSHYQFLREHLLLPLSDQRPAGVSCYRILLDVVTGELCVLEPSAPYFNFSTCSDSDVVRLLLDAPWHQRQQYEHYYDIRAFCISLKEASLNTQLPPYDTAESVQRWRTAEKQRLLRRFAIRGVQIEKLKACAEKFGIPETII